MKVLEFFDKDGKTLQQIIEQFLLDYCLQTGEKINN